MALASYPEARSPVELSLSPVYHYQFSSVFKALAYLAADSEDRQTLEESIQRMCMRYFDNSSYSHYLLQTDTTPVCKPHSPTLKERSYVSVPNNMIAGNKPLSIGYDVSFVNLSDPQSAWSLPLSIRRVSLQQTASECALAQLESLFSHPDLPFSEKLIVNTLDSKYGNAHYLSPAGEYENLVNITRLRTGMKVWKRYSGPSGNGAPRVYGEKYYLHAASRHKTYQHPKTKQPCQVFQRSLFELAADETGEFFTQTSKGRKLKIQLWRYNDMMIRTKNGHNMKDKPLDIIAIRVTDSITGKALFDQEMYIGICGQRKELVSTQEAYQFYRRRYDIEPYLRFSKQGLLLQQYQTPEIEHLENWLLILQLSTWLLYSASDEADFRPHKWEQYLPKNKTASDAPRLSMAQTRKAVERLFLTFDPTPFIPVKSKKGKGRQKGQTFTPRKRYRVVKKITHKRKSEQYTEKIE
jgi:hypothetical protein